MLAYLRMRSLVNDGLKLSFYGGLKMLFYDGLKMLFLAI
ncbi:hypothetical protein CGSSa00_09497 [Staphylococcus aureus subsp. aureus CGS00]|uniref:Uncharacterized protein n=1 Tax=Staphylococcus aureus (strain MRSA252) TaxID=282458 RepID=A0A7U7EVY8_STAAR|nr:hypothetical protein CGSSa00_09497 [Staphylococcus aureus subsp. aureus CGS00]CAG41277.1 hypothetical protein SAR2297a [Staphylococcus aureus subsp. aureus MRSA252]